MCFGSPAPQAPQIVYQGPSEEDIARQEENLNTYRTQVEETNAALAQTLNDQIAAANEQTASIQAQLDAEIAAAQGETSAAESAASAAVAEQQTAEADVVAAREEAVKAGNSFTPVGAYGVTVTESEPVAAQTTVSTKKKKTPDSTLKINTGGAAASPGSGLNIGL
jgi:sulfate adenylyltransferase subunit 1 (EFTu-like GTPase family)